MKCPECGFGTTQSRAGIAPCATCDPKVILDVAVERWRHRALRAEACIRKIHERSDDCTYCGALFSWTGPTSHAPSCELRAILDAAKGET